MGAILVDSATHIVKKIKRVEIDEMFVERMVMSWNPFRGTGDQYTKSFNDETFNKKVAEIFKIGLLTNLAKKIFKLRKFI